MAVTQTISSGQALPVAVLSGGTTQVLSGGTATTGTIANGGRLFLSSGGVISGNETNTGQVSGGTDIAGTLSVTSNAVVSSLTVSGGTVTEAVGAVVNNLILQSGGVLSNFGATASNTIISGGTFIASGTVFGGGNTFGAGTSGGTVILARGANFGAFQNLSNGNVIDILSGGELTGEVIGSGGVVSETAGGGVTGTTISGGTLILAGNGNGGGNNFGTGTSNGLLVLGSGTAAGNAGLGFGAPSGVSSGNTISVTSAGGLTGAAVSAGGSVVVGSGGFANGSTIAASGVEIVSSGGSIVGTTSISSGGTLVLNGPAGSGGVLIGSGGSLVLSGAMPTNVVSIVSGGRIDLTGIPLGSITSVTDTDGSVVFHLSGGGTYTVEKSGPNDYMLSSDGKGGTIFEICFAEGTMIATPDGERAVETIEAGDVVATLAGDRPVVWTGHRRVDVATMADPEPGWLVRIRQGAFADNVPHRDLLITQEHCVHVDGRLIPARMLVNGRSVLLDRTITAYRYHHIELERHGILLAEGLATESYLDTGNRRNFANSEVPALRPDFAVDPAHRSWAEAAAPLTTDRPSVEPVWTMLAERAGGAAEGVVPAPEALTTDPDLHVETGTGLRIRPLRRDGGRYSFLLPAGSERLRLVSRTARPSQVHGPFVDDRRALGVLVGTMTLWQGRKQSEVEGHLHDHDLDGWFGLEAAGAHRWTRGDAALPLDPACTAARPVVLDVEIVASGPFLLHGGRADGLEPVRLSA